MRKPLLNSLRMFDAAARHLNFTHAARELHLTQGAVAQHVRKLEADLGVALFTRQARGLMLTAQGARYHREITAALGRIDQATRALRPAPATVTLSVPPSLASKWLVPRLADLARAHPEILLELQASEHLSDFRRDSVDLVIRQGKPPRSGDLQTRALAPLDLCAVAIPGLGAPATDLAQLARFPLIEDGHRHWTRLFTDHGLPAPRSALGFNQTALAIDAALAGKGVALTPRLLVRDALKDGTLIALWRAPERGHGYYLLFPDTPHMARDTVISWLLAQV